MYLIRLIDGMYYLQLTEKLPRTIKNAIAHRYERSHRVVQVTLFALMLIAFVYEFWFVVHSNNDREDAGPLYWIGLVLIVVLTCLLARRMSLVSRHKKIRADLASEWDSASSQHRYLMPETDLIFEALMAPSLVSYLMDPDTSLWSDQKMYFEEYLDQAKILLARGRRAIGAEQSESERLKIKYATTKELNALGEEYASLIRMYSSDFGDYFHQRQKEAKEIFAFSSAALAVKSEKEIERLTGEVHKARMQAETQAADLQEAQAPIE